MMANFLFQRPRILFLVMAVILIAGVSSAWVIPKLEDPVLRKRVGVISTVFPGADTRMVESLVTMPLEQRLQNIAAIGEVRSTSRQSNSNIVIQLRNEVNDVDEVWDKVRRSVGDLAAALPPACREPQLEIFPLKAFAAIVSVQSTPGFESEPTRQLLTGRIAADLASRINRIDGTEDVQVFGKPAEEVRIELTPNTLSSLGLTTGSVAQQLSANFVTQPAGVLRMDRAELPMEVDRAEVNLQTIGEMFVRVPATGEMLAVSQIADVQRTTVSPRSDIALVDSRDAIVIGAFVDDHASIDHWDSRLQTLITDFQTQYAADVDVRVVFSQRQHINARLNTLLVNLLIAFLSVVGIVALLMGWRSVIVVGVAIPMAAAAVLFAMRLMDIPLHQMSVTGLIVALGMLIDNAIVMVEDMRHRMQRKAVTVAQAMGQSVNHLRVPLLGSTLTTVLAFLPIAMLPGPSGEFVSTIAIVVILAIVASLLLSISVIAAFFGVLGPSNVAREEGASAKAEPQRHWLSQLYRGALAVAFRVPMLTAMICCVLPALGFWASQSLPEQFFPASDRRQIQIEVELSAGSSIDQTRDAIASMEPTIASEAGVADAYWFIGRSAPTFYYNVVPRRRATPWYAQAIVDLADGASASEVVTRLQASLDREFPAARTVVRQMEQGPPLDAPIEIQVTGPEVETLKSIGSELRLFLSQMPLVSHTRSDMEESLTRMNIQTDRRESARSGLSSSAIASQVWQTFEGVAAGSAFEGYEEIPVRVVMATDSGTMTPQDLLANLQLTPASPSQGQGGVSRINGPPKSSPSAGPRLSAIASFSLDADIGAIVRVDGQRTNEVKAFVRPGVLTAEVVGAFRQRLALSDFRLPAGYTLTFAGESSGRRDAVRDLMANGMVIFSLMILTLVASLNSFRHAAIIVIVGALSTGLGPLALWCFGYPMGFMAIVGTMGLIGIAINDSIVVLSSIAGHQRISAEGSLDIDSLVEIVCGNTRHILATTLTTIVGFLPLVLGGGGFWPPLAVTISAGVAAATLMALLLVPSLWLMLHRPHR